MVKRIAVALFLLSVAAGCGGGMKLAGTKLTLTAINRNVGLAVFHLDCSPSGGDVSDPAAACSALARDPKLVTSPQPFSCLGGPSSWFDVTVAGDLAGKPVQRKFSTCWTPQMATLGKLGLVSSLERNLRPRRHGVVVRGVPRTFPPGTLRPGDVLVCGILHGVQLGIPDRFGSIGLVGTSNGTLSGARHHDGSVIATCRRRNG